jgi:hypothetical protein
MEQLPAIIGSIALLVTAVAGILGNRERTDRRIRLRVEQYGRWSVGMRLLVADLRAILADHQIPEPAGIDETLKFPPADESEKVNGDA